MCWLPAVTFLLLVTSCIPFDSQFMLSIGYTLTAIASASIIAALVSDQENIGQRFLMLRPLVYLGTISYGFYLWHFVFVSPLETRHINPLIITLFALPCSIGMAMLSSRYLEHPILKLRHRYAMERS
jgi:peptidoglycan/LPS O-acetylase OafA/YrhL